jgi:FMN phosphatase YigB (HAD superfamily)
MGRVNPADLDAVTVDAYGTLFTLEDPVPTLVAMLAEHGVERSADAVRAGVAAEIAYYAPRASQGHDEASLAELQEACARVFLESIDSDLDPHSFAPVYIGSLRFGILPGVLDALRTVRALGLELAVVANWDVSLRRLLEETRLGGYFGAIVHAAAKPAPDGLLRALDELGVEPARALHVGDDEKDEQASLSAGMRFAPAPLSDAVAQLA